MKKNSVPVAMILLYSQNSFLMQLRDDKPEILYPGLWGLFGGHLETGEQPDQGLIREVKEEIGYAISEFEFFRCYSDREAERHIFYAPLTVKLNELELNEGQDLDLVSSSDIELGSHYSSKIDQNRKLGKIHRQILLDFVNYAHQQKITLN